MYGFSGDQEQKGVNTSRRFPVYNLEFRRCKIVSTLPTCQPPHGNRRLFLVWLGRLSPPSAPRPSTKARRS
jgi:hypothetical protein